MFLRKRSDRNKDKNSVSFMNIFCFPDWVIKVGDGNKSGNAKTISKQGLPPGPLVCNILQAGKCAKML